MRTALCIIDMQYHFENSARVIINQVVHQVKLAQRRRDPIIVVEYDSDSIAEGDDETFTEIVDAIGEYPQKFLCKKENDDGGIEIVDVLKANKIFHSTLRLTGVNTDCCVFDTGCSLLDFGLKLEVSGSATNSNNDHEWGLDQFNDRGAKIVA